MAKEITTNIVINATPEKVWEVLTHFQAYSAWNPFIQSLDGNIQVGKKITVRLQPHDAKGMTFKPIVQHVVEKKTFSWLGHLLIPGLFDGKHAFELIDNGNGTTTFVHSETFKGLLIPFFKKFLEHNTKIAFEQMNVALKKRVESRIIR